MAGWKGEEVRKIGEGRKTFFGRGKRPRVSSFFLFFLLFSPSAIPLQGLLTLSSPWLMMVLRLERGPFGFETGPQETIAALFLEAPKGQSIKRLSHEAHQWKIWRKRLHCCRPLPAHGAMPEWGFPMALPAGYGRGASTAPFFAFFGASFRCKKSRRNSLAIFI